jgi:formamidopyrimidine-DNA glycosylase (fpg)
MPELPEVETIQRTLAPQITGRIIQSVQVLHTPCLQAGAEYLVHVQGARILGLGRRAKLLLVGVQPENPLPVIQGEDSPEGGEAWPASVSGIAHAPLVLVFHLKMTGRFFVHPAGTVPLKHTRLVFDLALPEGGMESERREEGADREQGRLFFDDMRTFGYCRIMRHEQIAAWGFYASLGPEPLEAGAEILARRFCGKKACIKSVLLDQRVVAGVGNIYADETLFRARVLPTAKNLSLETARKVAGALQGVLQQAVDECGSSIRDYRDALGNAGAFQNSFFVYGRKNLDCRVCGKLLEFSTVAGRGTTFCVHCQQ